MIYGPITDQLCTLSVFSGVITTNLSWTVLSSSHFCLQLHFHCSIHQCLISFFSKISYPLISEIPQMSFLIRSSLLINGDIPRSLSSWLPVLPFYVRISSGNPQNISQQNGTRFWAIITLAISKYFFIIHSTELNHLDMNLHSFQHIAFLITCFWGLGSLTFAVNSLSIKLATISVTKWELSN